MNIGKKVEMQNTIGIKTKLSTRILQKSLVIWSVKCVKSLFICE
jgi:hypothetical protein